MLSKPIQSHAAGHPGLHLPFPGLRHLNRLSIRVRLLLAMGFLAIMLVSSGTVGLVSMRATNHQMRSLYEDRLVAYAYLE